MSARATATEPRASLRAALPALAAAGIAIAIASAARHRLVEPAALTAACDAAPWRDAACTLRTLTVEAFIGQRIGLVALVAALAAAWAGSSRLALAALAAGGAGLVLYSVPSAAPAVVLAGMVLARASEPR